MLLAQLFEKMPPCEGILDPGRKYGVAHPVILDFAQTLAADRARAEISPLVLRRRHGILDRFVDRDVKGRIAQMGAVEVEHVSSQRNDVRGKLAVLADNRAA